MKRETLLLLIVLAIIATGGGVAYVMTRGFRNNNPGNLTYGTPWNGVVGNDGPYAVFDTLQNGIRALGKDLLAKMGRGLTTIRSIVTVYAPPSDNPTESYIGSVSARMDMDPDATLTVGDLANLADAIIYFENGHSTSAAVLQSGINAALNS